MLLCSIPFTLCTTLVVDIICYLFDNLNYFYSYFDISPVLFLTKLQKFIRIKYNNYTKTELNINILVLLTLLGGGTGLCITSISDIADDILSVERPLDK